jgi:hypothetical protein
MEINTAFIRRKHPSFKYLSSEENNCYRLILMRLDYLYNGMFFYEIAVETQFLLNYETGLAHKRTQVQKRKKALDPICTILWCRQQFKNQNIFSTSVIMGIVMPLIAKAQ